MKCEECGREIVTRGNSTMCKECKFKEKYPHIKFEQHKYFLKYVKAVLRENKITYEKFSEMINYSCGAVKDFLVLRNYSQPLKEAIEKEVEKLRK